MNMLQHILMRMFGRPEGALGSLGGMIMARTNRKMAESVIGLLQIRPHERVLEVGFGPGVAIALLARSASSGYVAGVDPSREMVAQARARNAAAIETGLVDLRQGSVERLLFSDDAFDAVMAVNSMQVWPDATAGLREVRRVMRTGGRIALGFTPYSCQSREGLIPVLSAAGFAEPRLFDVERGFCALARHV
jgi:ubiquinone/menaquinone biosynthesis C-methylase UbiE